MKTIGEALAAINFKKVSLTQILGDAEFGIVQLSELETKDIEENLKILSKLKDKLQIQPANSLLDNCLSENDMNIINSLFEDDEDIKDKHTCIECVQTISDIEESLIEIMDNSNINAARLVISSIMRLLFLLKSDLRNSTDSEFADIVIGNKDVDMIFNLRDNLDNIINLLK